MEQGVTGLAQRGVDDPAMIGVQLAAQLVAAVIVEPARQRLVGSSTGAGGAGRAARTITRNWATVATVATSANHRSR